MPHLSLLVNIAVALAYALAGGLLARRIGLPTIVGYLVAGVALGPFTPGFQGDHEAIGQLAEVGVILLMFGIGLHFSFSDLWQVRRIAVPGAVIQMAVISAAGWAVAITWGWTNGGAWLLGIALSVASTVVLIRALMDHAELDTPAGRVAIGWSVVEDLATVVLLVLLPAVFGTATGRGAGAIALAVGKAALFLTLMLVVGRRLLPALLGKIAQTRSRELFVLVALTAAVGTALASAQFFGVSIALGAFVAGVVVSESPFSHQVGADLLPFRDAFAVLFFVSIGMLVNPAYLAAHWDQVLIVSAIAIAGKAIVCAALCVALPASGHTALVVAAGRSQIGEFSFIIGQAGLMLGLLDQTQYSLILAAAIVSITLNPAIFKLVAPIERWLKRRPRAWRVINHEMGEAPPPGDKLANHVVIVGCGRVGRHIAEALSRMQMPRLVVEADASRLARLRELGVPVLFGDAANSEILGHAALSSARALVITLPDDAAALAVVATARHEAPNLPILARASTWEGARRLIAAGANQVVRPELEGGLEIVRRTLLDLNLPLRDVQRYTELVRREGLDESEKVSSERLGALDELVRASSSLDVAWLSVAAGSTLAGRTLAESTLRAQSGVSVVAIGRGDSLVSNPGPDEPLHPGDRVAVIGSAQQISKAQALIE